MRLGEPHVKQRDPALEHVVVSVTPHREHREFVVQTLVLQPLVPLRVKTPGRACSGHMPISVSGLIDPRRERPDFFARSARRSILRFSVAHGP